MNESARSLEEALGEALTLHRLGVFPELGTSFKTTNLIESVMARVEDKTCSVDHWRTSDQKLRWCAGALVAVEKQFRRVKGCEPHLTFIPLVCHGIHCCVMSLSRFHWHLDARFAFA